MGWRNRTANVHRNSFENNIRDLVRACTHKDLDVTQAKLGLSIAKDGSA